MTHSSRSLQNLVRAGDLTATFRPLPAERDERPRQGPPASVTVVRGLLGLVALGHLLSLVFLQARSIHGATAGAWVLHCSLSALMVVFVWKLPTGHCWVRRAATMSQVLSGVFSIVLWSSTINYRPLVPVLDVIGISVIALLWLPATSRLFFRSRH